MKCVVTGAAGFIGSHLCERLLADGHEVVGLDNLSGGHHDNLATCRKNRQFRFIYFDIEKTSWPIAVAGADWFFHLAAKADIVPSITLPTRYYNTNVTGTLNALEVAKMNKVKRFIYAASSSCYGIPDSYPTKETAPCRPMYPYALTKLMGEELVEHWSQVYGLEFVSLRLFNVYGPRARTSGAYGAVMGVFLAQIANGKPVTIVGDGKQTRDFTFVTDVVDAFVKAAESKVVGKFNIGAGSPSPINYVADALGATEKVFIPKRPGEPDCTHADNWLAKQLLGWVPRVSIGEGLSFLRTKKNEYKAAPVWTPETISRQTKEWFERLS